MNLTNWQSKSAFFYHFALDILDTKFNYCQIQIAFCMETKIKETT